MIQSHLQHKAEHSKRLLLPRADREQEHIRRLFPGCADARFQTYRLPAREYAVFGFEAENFLAFTTAALDQALQYGGLWLSKHKIAADGFTAELHPDREPDASFLELWLPIRPAQ